MAKNVYQENGFADRKAYLKSLATEYEVPYNQVAALASMLGPDEDFDGLVSELQDFAFFF